VDPTGLKGMTGQSGCCDIVRARKAQLHCILDYQENGTDITLCFSANLSTTGGSLNCTWNASDEIDPDRIRREFDPCLVDCAIAHEERHAEQCRRFGWQFMARCHTSERGAYMVELGCLIKKERQECCEK
jgi:hypothetical protein